MDITRIKQLSKQTDEARISADTNNPDAMAHYVRCRDLLYSEIEALYEKAIDFDMLITDVLDVADMIRLGRTNSDIDAAIVHLVSFPHIDDRISCTRLLAELDDSDFYRPNFYSDSVMHKLTRILYKYDQPRYDRLFHAILARALINWYNNTKEFILGNRKIIIPRHIRFVLRTRLSKDTLTEIGINLDPKITHSIRKSRLSYNAKIQKLIESAIK